MALETNFNLSPYFDDFETSAKLKNYHKEQITKWVKADPNISRLSVQQKLKDKFNLEISLSTARRAMKEVGFSYITPRKNHYKQDKKEAESFKKKSSR